MSRPKVDAPGIYVRVSIDYDDDEKFWDASPLAEAMFLRGLVFSKKRALDGFIPAGAVRRIGLRWPHDPMQEIDDLVRIGIWDEVEGGWKIRNFDIWQVTTEKQKLIQADKRRAGLTLGHSRGSHDVHPNDDCPVCQESSTRSAPAEHLLSRRSAETSYIDIDIDPSAAPAEHVLSTCSTDKGQESEVGAVGASVPEFQGIAHLPAARVVDEEGRLQMLAAARAILHPSPPGDAA